MTFEEFPLSTPLLRALEDIDIVQPTPIQEKTYRRIAAGGDLVGIAQTGTGKTFAYLLPIINGLEFSTQKHPRVIIIVPTRELVMQVKGEAEKLASYKNFRIKCVYGGANINTQKDNLYEGGCDILIGTPGRIYDIAVTGVIRLNSIKKVVIDEADEMLGLGFRPQLEQILEMIPQNHQTLMFSSTLKDDVATFINKNFKTPEVVEVAKRSTPIEKINQVVCEIPNFNTKINFLKYVLKDSSFKKTLIFAESKKHADLLFEKLSADFGDRVGVTHSNKSQNFRFNAVRAFEECRSNILIATDVVARGVDFTDISHVISMSPPENSLEYIHRIGRTGRADKSGNSILLYSPYEQSLFDAVMEYAGDNVRHVEIPTEVEISNVLNEEEKPIVAFKQYFRNPTLKNSGGAFHERSEKRKKTNSGGLKQKAKRKRGL